MLEIIMAISLFALVVSGVSNLIGTSLLGSQRSTQFVQATALADEAVEALRHIRDQGVNRFTVNTSGVETDGSRWNFTGEGTTETIGKYTRTITFSDVCRDGSNAVVACPGSYTDAGTAQAAVTVEWDAPVGVTHTVTRNVFLTNWDSSSWSQTDWSGGSGQATWSDATRYDSDDGNIDATTVAGQVTLATTGAGGCGTISWPMTTPANYTYDNQKIEVTGGNAQLISSGVGEIYGIIDAVVETYEHDTTNGLYSKIEHISGDVYAVLYQGSGGDGFVKTITIDSTNGDITNSSIDTLEYDASAVIEADLIHLSGTVYAIAYQGSGNDGYVATVHIQPDGTIDDAVFDVYEYDTSNGRSPEIVKISNTVIAIATRGAGADGFIDTIAIDGAGNITKSVIDSIEFDTVSGQDVDLIQVTGNMYAVVYRGSNNDGFIKTIEIDTNGNITNSVIDSFEYDTINGYFPSIVQVDTDTYAIAYQGLGNDGYLVTVTIAANGTITQSTVDSLVFDAAAITTPVIIPIENNIYLVVYEETGTSDGFAKIVSIDSAGNIGDTVLDTIEFNPTNVTTLDAVMVGTEFAAIAYGGSGSDGFLTTIGFDRHADNYPIDNPTITPASSASAGTVDEWTVFQETATKNGGEVYYQLSHNDGLTWLYWDGANWSIAGGTDYNTASIVNAQINNFPTSTETIAFKAFLSSDGSQQIQLDEVQIQCDKTYDWSFNVAGNYSYDDQKIDVTGGNAQLVSALGGSGILGIENASIDTYEFDTTQGQYPDSIHITGNIYAAAYTGPGADGFIRTFTIDDLGQISEPEIDILEFDTTQATWPSITHLTGDIYVISYTGSGSDGFVTTVSIASDGSISDAVLDNYEYDTRTGDTTDIIAIDIDTVAIASRGRGNDGFVDTIDIANDGTITASVVDALEFDTSNGYEPDIFHVVGDIYGIVYRGSGNDGFIKTVDIASNGTIGNSVIDTFEYDTFNGYTPHALAIDSDTFLISRYGAAAIDTVISTIDIDAAGNISAIIDQLVADTAPGYDTQTIHVEDNYYLLIYRGSGNDGFAKLVTVETNGQIGDAVIDTLEYDTSSGYYPSVQQLSADYYAIFYTGAGTDGFVRTIKIERAGNNYPSDNPSIIPTAPYVISSLNGYTGFQESATKNGGEIYYQLSANSGTTWLYWDGGSWSAAGALQYSTAADISSNMPTFPTSTNQFLFRAYLSSDGSQQVVLHNVKVLWGEGGSGGGGYQVAGLVTSSAFNMGKPSTPQFVSWSQDVSGCAGVCTIQLQMRAAPDSGGSPGVWSNWFGSGGDGTYFTTSTGNLIPFTYSGNGWMQYRVELSADGTETPILQDVTVNYR